CYTELDVDGGVKASLYLEPAMLGLEQEQERSRRSENTDVYVVIARKLQPPPRPARRRLLPIAKESIGALLTSRFEGDLLRVYQLARSAGARFTLTAIPDDSPEEPDTVTFDPGVMQEVRD